MVKRRKNQSLQRTGGQSPARRDEDDAVDAEPVLPTTQPNAPLINAEIVQILIQQNHPDQVKALMEADLDYNEKRLKIVREHAEKHPDAIDYRITRRSRRNQYMLLLILSIVLLGGMILVPIAVAAIFGTVAILIVSGILVNARERELDLQGFIKLINIVVGKQQPK